MNIWSAREKSLRWLNNELESEGEILQEGFDYLGDFVKLFEKIGQAEGESEKGQFCRISSITLAKYSHLLLGCYSLMLDGLAQESGALLRPLIEVYELLVYFRQDKTRIKQALEDKLPSAGVIGKSISGDYQDLRTYLNDNASHFSYKIDSVRHLFDKNIKIQPVPNHSLKVFRTNLQLLNAFQVFILFEAVNCLFAVEFDANSLADKIEKWRDTCVKIFPPEK
jgi:hypothetical protein